MRKNTRAGVATRRKGGILASSQQSQVQPPRKKTRLVVYYHCFGCSLFFCFCALRSQKDGSPKRAGGPLSYWGPRPGPIALRRVRRHRGPAWLFLLGELVTPPPAPSLTVTGSSVDRHAVFCGSLPGPGDGRQETGCRALPWTIQRLLAFEHAARRRAILEKAESGTHRLSPSNTSKDEKEGRCEHKLFNAKCYLARDQVG